MYITLYTKLFSWVVWDPDPVCFYVPFIHHPVVWYGVLFALGFLSAYFLGSFIFLKEIASRNLLDKANIQDEKQLIDLCKKYPKLFSQNELSINSILPLLNKYLKEKKLPFSFLKNLNHPSLQQAISVGDKLTTFLVIGLVLGARLGYVFFYGWPSFKANPIEIFKIWEGGLASHGACIGILIALFVFIKRQPLKKSSRLSFLQILDILAIISGLIAFFIRLGNFMNQEIVGLPTQMPWGILFGSPLGGESMVPRHPVQLYEAFFYLFMAIMMFRLWKQAYFKIGTGLLTGFLLVNLFTFRFFIEFFKEHQGAVITANQGIQMGQVLSLPFILLGMMLLLRPKLQKWQYKRSQS